MFDRARARRFAELANAISHLQAIAAPRAYAPELEQRGRTLESSAAMLRQSKPEACD